jgi:hypothetical protein
VLAYASAGITRLLAGGGSGELDGEGGGERRDGVTCARAGAIPMTLDRRGIDSEEAAKGRLWKSMQSAVEVPNDSHQDIDTWVRGFARDIAGHGHTAPALSLHPPGNVTKVHQHLMPVLHFLLQGVKYWFLWRPHSFRETVVGGGASGPPLLSYYAHRREGLADKSPLDTQDAGELIRKGRYACRRVTQTAGTMLYLPAGWYHFVVSAGVPDATALPDAFCVSVVTWIGTRNLRAASYLLALDDSVWEDQTPPDEEDPCWVVLPLDPNR